jgi:hypothetical protein
LLAILKQPDSNVNLVVGKRGWMDDNLILPIKVFTGFIEERIFLACILRLLPYVIYLLRSDGYQP